MDLLLNEESLFEGLQFIICMSKDIVVYGASALQKKQLMQLLIFNNKKIHYLNSNLDVAHQIELSTEYNLLTSNIEINFDESSFFWIILVIIQLCFNDSYCSLNYICLY